MIGLTLQDLLGQVVDDVAVVPGEAGDESGDVVSALHETAPPAGARRSTLRCAPPALPRPRAVSANPITPLRYAAASSGVKRRSAARISTSSPRPRNRASGNAGSARPAITRCTCGGRWSSRKAIPSCTSGASMTW